ncbi:23S rRNA (guanosine(2251)-2'-O)-methyltransferase RlmB [Teredinibacter waterburyi]|uniref:23S rRNA (guanosine(2251)-2'-O)-methyltransferase RlmB n=1 Tax=Teredinibacter waterburyi TaxID=1500538 RepID=UPI00165F74B8|nr:23S rRNA (guanosine(2251)-2'-O)-methyltransferase RlmB [Teredinibacter waterburyi]
MKQELVFGIHAVQSLLNAAPDRVQELVVSQGRQDQRLKNVLSLADTCGKPVRYLDRRDLDELCDGNHQGVIAYASQAKAYNEQALYDMLDDGSNPLILILDGVTDPHNLGACLRSADAAGVDAVVIPKDNSVGLTDVVRKVACGAAETVPLIAVTNLARSMKKMQEKGLWIAGAAGEAEQSIYEADLSGPRAIVMGAEGSGMRRLTRETCDDLVKIPMAGSVSSLNVSVATGVILYEVVRQRLAK